MYIGVEYMLVYIHRAVMLVCLQLCTYVGFTHLCDGHIQHSGPRWVLFHHSLFSYLLRPHCKCSQ
uniref:Uncharacterized protein n=1 Tax=Otarine gammaherpesvirus 4 TaxID=2801541 RepID=A0A889IWG0_9GAMA|nr:hypothetical protein [Otarine gammaherpesvirus 4]